MPKRRAPAAAPAAPKRAKVTKPAARVTAAPKPAKVAKPAAAAAAVATKPAEAEAYQQRIARAVSHGLEQHKSRPKSVGKKQACLLAARVAAKECIADQNAMCPPRRAAWLIAPHFNPSFTYTLSRRHSADCRQEVATSAELGGRARAVGVGSSQRRNPRLDGVGRCAD